MEVAGWVVSILGGAIVLVGIGYLRGLVASSPGSATLTTGMPADGTCPACAVWRTAQMAVCGARTELAMAISYRDTMYSAWLGVLAAAAAVLAASVAANFIPIVGPAVAASLFVLAASLLATASILGGYYTGAASAVLTKQDELNRRMAAEMAARDAVTATCPPAAAAMCLGSPPC